MGLSRSISILSLCHGFVLFLSNIRLASSVYELAHVINRCIWNWMNCLFWCVWNEFCFFGGSHYRINHSVFFHESPIVVPSCVSWLRISFLEVIDIAQCIVQSRLVIAFTLNVKWAVIIVIAIVHIWYRVRRFFFGLLKLFGIQTSISALFEYSFWKETKFISCVSFQ